MSNAERRLAREQRREESVRKRKRREQLASELERLVAMHEAGFLADREFRAAKARTIQGA
jgi:hypothetical protein